MSVENNPLVKYRLGTFASYLIKGALGIVLVWFLYHKISNALENNDFNNLLFSNNAPIWMGVAMILTVVNWLLEARKWQILSLTFQKLSLVTAYRSVLSGLSTGLITPNRIGNFIGRLAYIDDGNKVKASINTQMGNLAQFIVSIALGIIGLAITLLVLTPSLPSIGIVCIPLLLLLIAIWLFLSPKVIIKFPFGKKLYAPYTSEINDLIAIPTYTKWQILILSTIRYSVFLIQYYCLFKLFNVDTDLFMTISLAATTFLIITILPGVLFGKLIVRESAAVYVFGWISLPVQVILAVSFLLWFINLAIPSLVGWYFWIKKTGK